MLMLSLVSGIRKIRKGSVYFATAPLQLTASCNGSMAQIYNAMLLVHRIFIFIQFCTKLDFVRDYSVWREKNKGFEFLRNISYMYIIRLYEPRIVKPKEILFSYK